MAMPLNSLWYSAALFALTHKTVPFAGTGQSRWSLIAIRTNSDSAGLEVLNFWIIFESDTPMQPTSGTIRKTANSNIIVFNIFHSRGREPN